MDNSKIFNRVSDDMYDRLEFEEEPGIDEQPVDAEQEKQHVTVSSMRPDSSVNQYKLLVISLAVLAVILLTVNIGLGVYYRTLTGSYLLRDISGEMAKLQATYDQALQIKQEAQRQLVKERADHQLTKWELDYQIQRNKDYQKQIDKIPVEISKLTSHLPLLKEGCRHCLPGWSFIDDTCYYFATSETSSVRSWHAARQFCQEHDADLVVIKSREKQLAVIDFINHHHESRINYQNGYWIGMIDEEDEGAWKWVDGSRLSDGYWYTGEPNDRHNEDCAAVYPSENPFSSWNDAPCPYNLRWICEKEQTSMG